MWKKLFEIEPKYLLAAVTSIGSFLLLAYMLMAYREMAEVKTVEIANSVKDLVATVVSLKDLSREQLEAIRANTEATKELRQAIFQTKTQAIR